MKSLTTIILAFALTLSGSCKEKKTPRIERFNGFVQGTTYSIIYIDEKNIKPADLKVKTENLLKGFDMSLSLYQDSSILCRVNRNEDVIVDKYFTKAFKKSQEISRITEGTFDITIGPLVRAWGFGRDGHKNISDSKHDSLMKLVGMDKVSLKGGRVIKADPAIQLDFNAMAQGYSVDVVCEFFNKLGIKNYLVEIGGEVRARGTKLGEKWRIGIDRPVDGNHSPGSMLEAIILISDEALNTSGNYRRFYIEDGVKYSHTINPKTGYPAKNNLLSATILASECGTADAIATACMVMGLDRAIEFIGTHPAYLAYFIYSDENGNFATWASPALAERITEMQDN